MTVEWHPNRHIEPYSPEADDLDGHVRGIDWSTPEAVAPGSPERLRVAGWVASTDLVDREVRRSIPRQAERAERMVEYCAPRITERITHEEIVSRSSQWNRNNLWDPTLGTSLCGWVRRTVRALVHVNAGRVLNGGDLNTGALERDDGSNPLLDRLAAVEDVGNVFDGHPRMRIIRPDRPLRDRWLAMLTGPDGKREVAREARRLGLARDCPDVDDGTVCALLLTPLTRAQARRLEDADYGVALGDAPRLYALAETRRLSERESGALRAAVEHAAASNGMGEADVLALLGGRAARLAAV